MDQGWSRSIRAQLRKRDQEQAYPFTEIFNHYNHVQTELALSKFHNKVQSSGTKSGGAGGAGSQQNNAEIRQYISQLLTQNATLARDLALMDERNSQSEALLLSRQMKIEQLRELEGENRKLQQYLNESEKTLKNAGSKLDEQEKLIQAFQKALESLQQENQDLRTTIEEQKIDKTLVGGKPTGQGGLFFGADDVKTEAVAWNVKQPAQIPLGYKYHHRLSTDPKVTLNCVTYHGQGSAIAAGTSDGRVIFAQSRTGKIGNTVEASKSAITSIASSPDRGNIVFTDGDKHLFLFDTISRSRPTRASLPSIGIQTSYLTSNTIVVINKGRIDSVLIYDCSDKNELKLEQKISTDSTPTAMATHNTSLGIAISHFDKSLSIWTQGPSQLQKLLTLDGIHTLRVTSLAYHPSQPLLLTNSWDAKMNIIDTRTGQISQQINGHLGNYVNKLETGKAVFCSEGTYVAAGSHDGTVKIWDTRMLPNMITNQKPVDFLNANNYPGGLVATLAPTQQCSRNPVTGLEWNINGRQIVAVDQMNLVAYE